MPVILFVRDFLRDGVCFLTAMTDGVFLVPDSYSMYYVSLKLFVDVCCYKRQTMFFYT